MRLNRKLATGGTVRSQLESVWQQTGKRPAELVDNELPMAIAHVWDWFVELTRTRRYGMSAPEPISYQEMAAWAELTGREPTPFEVGCLTAVDDVVLKAA